MQKINVLLLLLHNVIELDFNKLKLEPFLHAK